MTFSIHQPEVMMVKAIRQKPLAMTLVAKNKAFQRSTQIKKRKFKGIDHISLTSKSTASFTASIGVLGVSRFPNINCLTTTQCLQPLL